MHKLLKKTLAAVLSAVLVVGSANAIAEPVTAQASTTTSWNFKNSSFKDLGTISSTVTVDDLTLIATSSKTMTVKADSQTVDDTEYTYCLALGGSGCTSYRAVQVPVSGNDTIKVTLMSSGSSSRSLAIADASGNQLTTLTAGTSASTESYSYSGDSGSVYLYSTGSGINIYKIQVDSYSDSSSSSSDSTLIADGWYYIKNINIRLSN